MLSMLSIVYVRALRGRGGIKAVCFINGRNNDQRTNITVSHEATPNTLFQKQLN